MNDYEVLFDGTADRPWGRMLFAPQSVQREHVPLRSPIYGEITALIKAKKAIMGNDWHTVAEIAALIHQPVAIVMSPVGTLAHTGQFEREHAPLGGRWGGVIQRYRWRT